MGRPLAISILATGQVMVGISAIAGPFVGALPDFYPTWAAIWYVCTGLIHIISAVLLWRLRKLGPALFGLCFVGGLVLATLLSPVYAHFSLRGVVPWLAVGLVYGAVVYTYRVRFTVRAS